MSPSPTSPKNTAWHPRPGEGARSLSGEPDYLVEISSQLGRLHAELANLSFIPSPTLLGERTDAPDFYDPALLDPTLLSRLFLEPEWVADPDNRRAALTVLEMTFAHLAEHAALPRQGGETVHDTILTSIIGAKITESQRLDLLDRLLNLGPVISRSASVSAAFAIYPEQAGSMVESSFALPMPSDRERALAISQRLRIEGQAIYDGVRDRRPEEYAWEICETLREIDGAIRQLGTTPGSMQRSRDPLTVPFPPKTSLLVALYARGLRSVQETGSRAAASPEAEPLERADRPGSATAALWRDRNAASFIADATFQDLLRREFGITPSDLSARDVFYLTRALSCTSVQRGDRLLTFLKEFGNAGAKALVVGEYGTGVMNSLIEMSSALPRKEFGELLGTFVSALNSLDSAISAWAALCDTRSEHGAMSGAESRLQRHIHEGLIRATTNVLLSPSLFLLHPESVRNRPERFQLADTQRALRAIATIFEVVSPECRLDRQALPSEQTFELIATARSENPDREQPQYLLRVLIRPTPETMNKDGKTRSVEARMNIELRFEPPKRFSTLPGGRISVRPDGPEFQSDQELADAFRQKRRLGPFDERGESVLRIALDLPQRTSGQILSLDFGRSEYFYADHDVSRSGDIVGELQRLNNQGADDYEGGHHYTAPFESGEAMFAAFTSIGLKTRAALSEYNRELRRELRLSRRSRVS